MMFSDKQLKQLIIPLLVEQILAVTVGLADSVMIAGVGEAAVSGVSLVDTVMVLLINVFSALATGGAVVSGQYLGQKHSADASKAADQLVLFTGALSLVITVLVYGGQNLILDGVFGKIEADVMKNARIYLVIVTASIPFLALYNAGAALFRAMGNSQISMKTLLTYERHQHLRKWNPDFWTEMGGGRSCHSNPGFQNGGSGGDFTASSKTGSGDSSDKTIPVEV